MACLYRSIDEFHHEDSILATLKSCCILPLANMELVSLQDKTVFFPLEDTTSKKTKNGMPLVHFFAEIIN